MHHFRHLRLAVLRLMFPSMFLVLVVCAPEVSIAQASPFMTGATSLQTNIVAWLTPVAIILVMVLGGMAMANRIAQVSNIYGAGDAQTIVENCSNTLILRCSGSENGGTSQFASRLIGDREIVRRQISRGSDHEAAFSIKGMRRSKSSSEQHIMEAAVMPSQIEQLPDLCGYFKAASSDVWLRAVFDADRRRRSRAS
jgi:Type IV secretion-system coupling protein DNA-binding domain